MTTWITVIDVITQLGFEPRKELTWSVGNRMAEWYTRTFGHAPLKDLRPKTAGEGGSHCFAHYPDCFFGVIEGFVRMCAFEVARQGDLFRAPDGDGQGQRAKGSHGIEVEGFGQNDN